MAGRSEPSCNDLGTLCEHCASLFSGSGLRWHSEFISPFLRDLATYGCMELCLTHSYQEELYPAWVCVRQHELANPGVDTRAMSPISEHPVFTLRRTCEQACQVVRASYNLHMSRITLCAGGRHQPSISYFASPPMKTNVQVQQARPQPHIYYSASP